MNSLVKIPGTLTARVVNGRIAGYSFLISANDAGYFGEPFICIDGDEITHDDFSDMVDDAVTISNDNQSAFILVELES